MSGNKKKHRKHKANGADRKINTVKQQAKPRQEAEARQEANPLQEAKPLQEAEAQQEGEARQEAKPQQEANPLKEAEARQEAKPQQEAEARQEAPPRQDNKTESCTGEQAAIKTMPEQEEAGSPPEKNKKKKIIQAVGLTVAALLLAGGITAGIWYGKGVEKYKTCFVQGTVINGIDCGDKKPEELCQILDRQIQGYVLEVYGRDPQNPMKNVRIGKITPEDIQLHKVDTESLVGAVFGKQDPYKWVEMYWKTPESITFQQDLAFDQGMLEDLVGSWEACSDKAVAPRDAVISEFLPKEKGYTIIPETLGARLEDYRSILPHLEEAIYSGETRIDIESFDCYEKAKVTARDKDLQELVKEMNRLLQAEITYDWYGEEFTVDAALLRPWISMEDGTAVLDEEAVAGFIRKKSKELDPRGHKYPFTTSLGAEVTLECKSGWKTDVEKETEELIALIKEGAVTDRIPASSTRNYVQFSRETGVGDSYVEADLTNQHYYLYYGGELVLETDFVSGNMQTGNGTPEGIFATTYKTTNRVLRGPGYASFVYYWMPYYGNYGMHDATWRSVFGGQIYQTNGSHGCLNLPLEAAKVVYEYVETGFPVVCYYYPEGMNPKKQEEGSQEGAEELIEENEIRGQW